MYQKDWNKKEINWELLHLVTPNMKANHNLIIKVYYPKPNQVYWNN